MFRARPAPAEPVNKWLVAISVTFGTLMGTIDSSIVNVAVPHIRGAVGATVEEITWIATGFIIASVLVMPLTAFLGRLFGQKNVYMFCLALFVLGSALCGMARSLTSLVIFRVVQGFGAGALQPTEQAILRQTFPPEEHGMAMALFSVAVIIGPAFGPTLGGWIVDNYSWPWIFYINLPIGILALFMVSRFVHEPEDIRAANLAAATEQRKYMDWVGIALLSVGIGALQYVLEEGQRDYWFESRLITILTLVAAFSLAAFVLRELTARAPAVDLRLFKDGVFSSSSVVGAIMFAVLMSVTFLLPVFMQELLGFDATQSGIALMPRALVMMVCAPIVGKLYNHISPRIFVAVGVILYALSAVDMSHYTLATSESGIIWPIVIQGVAFSLLFIPLTTLALSTIPRHKLADASGLYGLIRQVGGSMGLAAFATLLPRYVTDAGASMSAHLTPGNPTLISRLSALTHLFMARGSDPVSARDSAIHVLGFVILKQSNVLAFEKLFLLSGICFLAVLPLLVFLKTSNNRTATKVEMTVEM